MEGEAFVTVEPLPNLGVLMGGVMSRMTWTIFPTGISASIVLRKRINS